MCDNDIIVDEPTRMEALWKGVIRLGKIIFRRFARTFDIIL